MSNKPATRDRLKKLNQPAHRSVRFSLDVEVEEKFRDARRKLDAAKQKADRLPTNPTVEGALATAKQEYADAEREMAEHSVKLTFRSLGRKSYDELVGAHTMTKERIDQLVSDGKISEEQSSESSWDPESFPDALMTACFVEEDGLTLEEFTEWIGSAYCTQVELAQMFGACLEANNSTRVVVLGNGSGTR